MKETIRHVSPWQLRTQLICATVLVLLGCALAIAGFYAPPTGEIHSSVLVLFGEILTFVGAIFGIDYHYKSKTIHHKRYGKF